MEPACCKLHTTCTVSIDSNAAPDNIHQSCTWARACLTSTQAPRKCSQVQYCSLGRGGTTQLWAAQQLHSLSPGPHCLPNAQPHKASANPLAGRSRTNPLPGAWVSVSGLPHLTMQLQNRQILMPTWAEGRNAHFCSLASPLGSGYRARAEHRKTC